MHIERSLVLLTGLFGVELWGVVSIVPSDDPALLFAGVGILFSVVLVRTVVILIANASRHRHSKAGHGRIL